MKKRNTEIEYEIFNKSFPSHSIFNLTYEDLIKHNQKLLFEIQAFLGLKETQLSTLLEKQNPEELDELIINYEEIGDP